MEYVILVDEQDNEIGTMPKMDAHIKGELHRAFSIFIFNEKNEMLLQQRADSKYHSGGLWTNACCSHPRPQENLMEAANRRLFEELGFTTTLNKIFDFTYHASFDNGLVENEFDHVFEGVHTGQINANAEEVKDYAYRNLDEIENEIIRNPHQFTAWFAIAFPKVKQWKEKQASIND